MKTSLLAMGGLGVALLLPAPGPAQTMPGGPDAPRSGAPAEVLRHSRDRANPTAGPVREPAARLDEAARRADRLGAGRDPRQLLEAAQQALDRGNWPLARELVERAHTTLLNAHVQGATRGDAGDDAEALRAVGAASAAVGSRDRTRAREAIREARQAAARMGEGQGMTGAAAGPPASEGMGGRGAAGPAMSGPGGAARGTEGPGAARPGMSGPGSPSGLAPIRPGAGTGAAAPIPPSLGGGPRPSAGVAGSWAPDPRLPPPPMPAPRMDGPLAPAPLPPAGPPTRR